MAVTRFAFDRTAIEEAEAAFAASGSMDQILGYVRIALPIVVLIVAFIFFRLLMRSVSKRGYRLMEAPQQALAAGAGAAIAAPQPAARAALAPPPTDHRSEVEERVTELVDQQPDRVADVVQAWIRED